MNASETTLFLLILALMLAAARGLGELFRAFKQPMIIGEILAGIILGPSIFGMLMPDTFNTLFRSSIAINHALESFALIGVVMLLIVSGLEVNLGIMVRQSKVAGLTSLVGILFTFAAGFALSYLFPGFLGMAGNQDKLVFSLFIGTALSITALPVVAKILMDLNLFKSEIGSTVIASAMFNDIVGWIVFSILLSLISTGGHGFDPGTTVLLVLSFTAVILVVGRKIFNKLIPIAQKRFSYPGSVLNLIFILGLLGAAFTEYIGVHAIFGAFIVGIAIGDSAHLRETTREIIQQFVTNIFAPLFFISIGLKVNFFLHFDFFLTITLIIVATIAKVAGSTLGARMGGMNKDESLAIGFGMNAHGAMEIILGLLALQFNLITEKTFVALVLMAIATSIISGPMMAVFAGRLKKSRTLRGLLTREYIYPVSGKTKAEVLEFLSEKAATHSGIPKDKILHDILVREQMGSTVIAPGLALPHAKIAGDKPMILCAAAHDGIEYPGESDTPVKLVLLLLTPAGNTNLQLQLLAEIASHFRGREFNELPPAGSSQEILLKYIFPNPAD